MPNLRSQTRGIEYLQDTYHPAITSSRRNLNREFNYKEILTFTDYYVMDQRTLGSVGNNFVPMLCWEKNPLIKDGEDGDGKTTEFEQDVQYLIKHLSLYEVLYTLHRYSNVGQYGGVIIAAKEKTTNGRMPAPQKPIQKLDGVEDVVRLTPLYQDRLWTTGVATISDMQDERYGMPQYFDYRENVVSNQDDEQNNRQYRLDASRVFTFSETAPIGSIYGVPKNQRGYNHIQDIIKLLGSNAEGYWKNARQAIYLVVKDDRIASRLDDPKFKAAFDEKMEEFFDQFNKSQVAYGMEPMSIQTTLKDVNDDFLAHLQAYVSAVEPGVPVTSIFGHQVGERASSNDGDKMAKLTRSRQENVLTPKMILPFFKWLIDMGAVRPPKNEICVDWPDPQELTEKDQLEIMSEKYKINELAAKAGLDIPFPDANENRQKAGYEEVKLIKPFGEDDAD